MATLEKIRKRAGLLVTVVGVALFSFIIGDLLNSGTTVFKSNQNNVVVVNGNAVDYPDYWAREKELTEIYQMQTRSSNLNDNYMTQIRQAVYEDIVMEKILLPRLAKLGMIVTSEEMTDMVEGENISPVLLQNPMFQNPETGQFDRSTVINLLNQIKNIENYNPEAQAQLMQYRTMWLFWEKNIKRNRMSEKYSTLLSKAIVANSLDAKDAFNNSLESSDIVFLMQPFSTIPDSTVVISQSEIEGLYKKRKETLRQEETCIIDYVAVDITPSQEDYDKVAKEMDAIRSALETTDNIPALTNEKSERKFANVYYSFTSFGEDLEMKDFVETAKVGDIIGPTFKNNKYRILTLIDKIEAADSVKVSEIMLAPRATDEETKLYADSLLKVLNQGANFSEIAMTHSVDEMAETGGDLGWMTEAGALQGLNEEFKNIVFSLPIGKCGFVKSTYGYHIVTVTEKTKNVPKYKVSDIEYTVIPSSATRSRLYNSLNNFIAINNSSEKMKDAAPENGYELVSNAHVLSTDMTIGIVKGARQVVRWAFLHKKNDISEIYECDDKFVVAAHKGRLPKGYQSVATASPQLKTELMSQKKGEILSANLKSKNLSSITAYAIDMAEIIDTVKFINMATSRITNIGVEPKLNAHITLSPLNKVSEPIAGNSGVYVFEVFNRTTAEKTYDEQQEKNMLESSMSYRIGGLVFRFLQQNADIEDNRIRFH